MKINLRLRTDSQNWELQCANCILHSFCDYVCVIFFSEPGAKTAQHVQVNSAISRDNFLWIPSVILSFRFLTSRSSLLFLITPVLDRFPSPCRTCHPVSAFFNIPLHFFFILFITDGGTRSWCGWTTGQVDPLQFLSLFLYYILLFFSRWGKFD